MNNTEELEALVAKLRRLKLAFDIVIVVSLASTLLIFGLLLLRAHQHAGGDGQQPQAVHTGEPHD